MNKLPENKIFGLELELSSALELSAEQVAARLRDNRTDIDVISSYIEGRSASSRWKIVPDTSITCNISQLDCNKFKLVSPPLVAEKGHASVIQMLKN